MKKDLYFLKFSIVLGMALTLMIASTTSCANMGDVTGGDKDTVPPRIIRETPPNMSLQFSENKIELVFDEYLRSGGFAEQFIVSPPFKNKPEFKLAGKKLTLIFNDTLQENATYALSFGNGLADLNEGNVIKGYKYVFSTGNHIDSLQIKGSVKGLEEISKYDDFIAMLYPIDSLIIDSIPLQELPLYYSKLDENGRFSIEYLKEDFFRLLVIEDKNNNFKYDPSVDAIGFFADSVPAGVAIDVPLLIFTERGKSIAQMPRIVNPYEMVVSFTAPFDSLLPYVVDENYPILTQRVNKNRDSLHLYFSNPIKDSLCVVLRGIESSDTLKAKTGSVKPPFWKLKTLPNQSLNPRETFTISSSLPVFETDSSKIWVIENKVDTLQDTVSFQIIKDTSLLELTIQFEAKRDSKYKILLYPGALTTYPDLKHDTIIRDLVTKKKDDFGILIIDMEKESDLPIFVELSDERGNIIWKKSLAQGKTQLKIEDMEPAKYKLRAVYDKNENGRWDTGDYLKGLQPEEILNYTEDIVLRANWDLELTWKVTF